MPRDGKIDRIQGNSVSQALATVAGPFLLSLAVRTDYPMGPLSPKCWMLHFA